ncbi:tetratricopeptide repeat protein [Motiliproteus sp. SC1-56]|uniref:tetratricopeptide repeat protein n=1 Tax=Motiliproteus sp. SC1-56 TaxID=2799565 RepID=UPI001A8ED1D9|nr:tetratricopeptide repeat protein [Motiliproteus sp. SC1-56]
MRPAKVAACLAGLLITVWGVRAFAVDPRESLFLLRWEPSETFYQAWADAKAGAIEGLEGLERVALDGLLMEGLLESHTQPLGGRRELLHPPSKVYTLDVLNDAWLQRSLSFYQQGEWQATEDALKRLSTPLNFEHRQQALLLQGNLRIRQGQDQAAEQQFRSISAESLLWPLARYNLALLQLRQSRLGDAERTLQQLNDWLDDNDQTRSRLGERTRLLETRLHARQGKLSAALKRLRRFAIDHPLYPQARQVEADLKRHGGDPAGALPALLQLSLQPTQSRLAHHETALLNTLEQLGASRQVLELGERRLPDLLATLRQTQALALHLSSPEFLEQLLNGQLDSEGDRLRRRLGREAWVLIAEIERLGTLRRLLKRTQELLPRYQPLFDRGYGHLQSLASLHPELQPSKIYRLPPEIASSGQAEFEQDLSDLVGQPSPWQDRYDIFRGMSEWQHGGAPWMVNGHPDPAQARPALAQDLAERRELVDQLSHAQVEKSAARLIRLTQRAGAMGQQLAELDRLLRPRLGLLLQQEALRMTRGIEQQVLWLADRTLLQAEEIDHPQPQPRFNLSVAGSGEVNVNRLETAAAVPHSTNAFEALRLLTEEAFNPEVRHRAKRLLADLHLASAERRAAGTPDPSGFTGSFAQAIRYYEELLEAQRAPPEDPAVLLYHLAHAYSLTGDLESALDRLKRLAALYPEHPKNQETLFRIAENHFSLGHYHEAAQRYDQLLSRWPQGEFSARARHKLGWSQFKLGEYRLALAQLLPLLKSHWPEREQQRSLVDDLLRVSAMSFSHLGGVDPLAAHFADQPPSTLEQTLLETQAAYMEEKERYTDAAESYRQLLARFPDAPAAPDYQAARVRVFQHAGFISQLWPAREAFVQRFGADSSYWQAADDSVRQKLRTYLADYLPLLAQRAHARGQKSKAPADYERALSGYRHFIQALPDHPQAAHMQFLLAEALSEQGRHAEAAEAYTLAGYQYPGYAKRHEAAYAELLAYQSLFQTAPAAQKRSWLERSIRRSHAFIDRYPEASQTPEVITKLAEELLIDASPDQALTTARRLADNPPQALALRLWRVIAHSAFDLERYAEAESAYRQTLALAPPQPEVDAFIRRMAESIYKQAEQALATGDQNGAIDHYLRLQRAVPQSPLVPKAAFEAARLLMAGKHWRRAIEQLEAFRERFQGHPLQATVPDKLVVAFEETAQWQRAAEELRGIFEREGETPLGRDALWRAAELHEKAGNPALTARGYELYIQRFPRPLDTAMEARRQLLRLAELPQVSRDPNAIRKAIITAHESAGAAATPRSRFLASEASLALARQAKTEYDRIPLTLPLERSLAQKKAAMERSIEALTRTTDYGLAEHATQATALIGEIYIELARSLMNSERPRELDELALEQYDILLEEEAIPFEEKAITLHELNLDRIQEGIFTPAMAESLERLRELMPSRYDKTEVIDDVVAEIQ